MRQWQLGSGRAAPVRTPPQLDAAGDRG